MLAAFCEYGIRPAIEKFVGMFAVALWDCRESSLYLARDRAGEKPLYYGWNRGIFLFGSELKALRAFPHFRDDVDPQTLALYMRYSYIPAPHSIYKDIFKLPPGSILCLKTLHFQNQETPAVEYYWSLSSALERGQAHPFEGDAAAAADRLNQLLNEAVAMQMAAD